jgi:hypothetical protein
MTDEPFPHLLPEDWLSPTILPLGPDSTKAEELRKTKSAEIIATRRSEAVATGQMRQLSAGSTFDALDFYQAARDIQEQGVQDSINITRQAAQNTAAMAVANAQLYGVAQSSLAIRNGMAAQSMLRYMV